MTPLEPGGDDAVTLRFLVAPGDMDAMGGSVLAGRVLEWIDKADYAAPANIITDR